VEVLVVVVTNGVDVDESGCEGVGVDVLVDARQPSPYA
jgi:hypothetical protein